MANWATVISALARIMCSLAALGAAAVPALAQQRVLGLDISAWQGNISQTTWNNFLNAENREFAFIRSSRGGTTGYYNQSDPNNENGQNTLSQRYDDPYFVQNITRATNAGILAGSYHFSRPNILSNTGTDEADHFMQMAGAWMRPGYLLPVHDLEAGDGVRSDNAMAQFTLDFSNRIYDVMGIRPAIYVNGNYANYVLGGASSSLRAQIVQTHPDLWIARWPNQNNPNAIDVQGANPDDSLSWLYGIWDDYGNSQPWHFWQYASTGRLQSFNNGGSNLDFNVAHGGIEYVKDHLVPALWMNNSSGEWTTLANWNSGQAPIAPVQGPGQVARVGPLTLPNPRLPGVDDGPRNVEGENDTVILDRPDANITVTHSSGTHSIRKLYARESLNVTGGSLIIKYVPSPDSTPISAQFSAAVSLSGSGALSVHTLQVDSTRTFTLGGGTLTFDTINLMPHGATPAKIALTGGVAINPLDNATATINKGAGAGSTGFIELGGAAPTLNVGNGAGDVDLSVNVPLTGMLLGAANTFAGPVTIDQGALRYGHAAGLPSTAVVTVNSGGRLEMNGISDTFAALASDPFHNSGMVMQGAANLTLSSPSGSNTYAGLINGSGSFTKSGGSTQILSGNNFLGAVNVDGGALILNGTNTTGAVTVNDGGLLGGSGSVTGPIAVNSGGHLAPGQSIGFFWANGGLTLQDGSVLEFELDTVNDTDISDLIISTASNGLTINGGTLNLTDSGNMTDGTYSLFAYAGALGGSLENLSLGDTPDGFNYSLLDTGTLIQLVVTNIGLPGDFNGDGFVDAADYAVLRKGMGSTYNEEHFNEWRTNFGEDSGSGNGSNSVGTVPEPATWALFITVLSTLGFVRRWRPIARL
jgi:autotransporter-associated beta strand protein